ncbi:ribonuclease H-like domain-containing protein [Tanacetum coccineum]
MVEKPVLNNKGRVTGQKKIRLVWNNAQRVNHQNKLTLPHPKRNFVPTTVATKSGQVPVNAAKQCSPRVATSISTPGRVKTATPNPEIGIHNILTGIQGIFESGLLRHMTETRSLKGGKITGKVFSSLRMNETECLVLSPDFKLLDESQVLLKVPRHDNMYSFDLKNFVPLGGLTCLFAKDTIDESNLWHRRLGHINFKTMNKLVRGNLDETSGILKTFITGIENQINHKVKIIRYDNGTEFKNNDMNKFCGMKGIKREFSVAKTPQQNRVAVRKNKTLIEATRTMLAYSLLPTTFWAEAVNTACYVHNRVLVTKPHNKTPYELLHGRPSSISFMRHFGCPVTILNTLDPLGKFDGKADEGFLVGYSINSKDFMVFNIRTRKVEENLHITFLENKPNVAGSRPDWLFDIDLLTNSMNYEPVTAGNQTNENAGIKDNTQQYILLLLLSDSPHSSEDVVANDAGKKTTKEPANKGERNGQEKEGGASNKEGDQNPCPQGLPTAGIDDGASCVEEVWIFLPELILTFPCKLTTSLGVPSNLVTWNTALLQPFDFSIHDFYLFLDKIKLVVQNESINGNSLNGSLA